MEAHYNLAVHETVEFETLQVFVAGTNTISIIEHVLTLEGESRFQITEDVFISLEPQPLETDQTSVAKSGDFLVIKQTSQRNLGLMPICQLGFQYETNNFKCRPCEPGLKSYGLQEDECISCMRAWLKGRNNEFKEAQYEQFCQDG